MIEVSIYALIRPTERGEKVVHAVEKIFPGLIMDIRGDRIDAYDGVDALQTFRKLLREQQNFRYSQIDHAPWPGGRVYSV